MRVYAWLRLCIGTYCHHRLACLASPCQPKPMATFPKVVRNPKKFDFSSTKNHNIENTFLDILSTITLLLTWELNIFKINFFKLLRKKVQHKYSFVHVHICIKLNAYYISHTFRLRVQNLTDFIYLPSKNEPTMFLVAMKSLACVKHITFIIFFGNMISSFVTV